ncbi:NACHT, LRR and PYD domains-containing protein 12-like [Oculina patagonica]
MERKERLRKYSQVSETQQVKHCQEIFIPTTDRKENPKSILLTGKAGIGKTLFSQKLFRDWADNKLFQAQTNVEIPDFKFAYLLTFRQLNLLGDDLFTLRELLNRSSVLDERSNIDESLFKYIENHSEEVLIVIDGYDESSQQDYIASNLDQRYPNSAQEKMPVAALCAKLIKGKILRRSVVMTTSRPDESDKLNRIHFDRYVEITGYSEHQVKEYIGKYFKEKENMKNAVLDHITKNENLVSFAHIPVLCFLMCSYMEYKLKESMSTDALPVKTSDLYFEVLKRFVLDHNKKEIPSEVTLDKLSELAAQLLLEKRFLFVKEDMKVFSLEEVENLRASGLLHSGPLYWKSLSQVTKHFCFTHLTLQEYLAARWFVKRKEIPPTESVHPLVMQFMSGILSKEKDNKLMENLLEALPSSNASKDILLKAKCLTEYEDKEFAKNIIKKHPCQYSDGKGEIEFKKLTDLDCNAVSFLLDAFSTLNEEADTRYQTFSEQAFIVKRLKIILSSVLTRTGVRRICNSLEKDACTVTELKLSYCRLDVGCVDCITELVFSKLTELLLIGNQITNASVVSLSQALQSSTCRVTKLDLSYNHITDAGVVNLSEALKSSACQITSLNLGFNQITDAGVVTLSEALQSSACQVNFLYLHGNQITDVGVDNLSQALRSSACQVTSLYLNYNQITDAGVKSLSQTLQSSASQVTLLYLTGNQITDAGVASLSQALQSPACQVTSLSLSSNAKITNAGRKRLENLEIKKPDLLLYY